MTAPRVLNVRDFLPGALPAGAVYVGDRNTRGPRRFAPSPWANLWKIGKHGTREEVITKYEPYALEQLYDNSAWLVPLIDKDLLCWCSPAACHAEWLVQLAVASREDRPMPMLRADYPADWSQRARAVKEAAAWCCETCGRQCRRLGEPFDTHRRTLTVAHIDPAAGGNHERSNLRALCSGCHNRLDAPMRAKNAVATLRQQKLAAAAAAGQMPL